MDDAAGVPYPTLHEQGNALTLDPLAAFGRMPSVIVGNPPFDGNEPASAFLDRALDLLISKQSDFPRYLGMAGCRGSFIKVKREQETARTRLLRHARILEMWELPEHAIGRCAETPTCVILAEVSNDASEEKQNVRVAQTLSRRDDAVDALRDSGVTTWSYVGNLRILRNADDAVMQDALAFSVIDDIWEELSTQAQLAGCLVEVVWGFVHTKSRGQPEPVFSPSPALDFVPYVRQQNALRPYTLTKEDWKASHDDDLMYWERGTGYGAVSRGTGRKPRILRRLSSKLRGNWNFLISTRGRRWISRNTTPLSTQVVILVKDWETSFRQAYPSVGSGISSEEVLRWFCAILNSPVGHAWFVKNAGPRGPQADVCLTMPLPRSYDPAIPAAIERLQAMPRPHNIMAVATWNPEAGLMSHTGDLFGDAADATAQVNSFWQAIAALNDQVMSSYGLEEAST